MEQGIFINQAFTYAINLYLTHKQNNENPIFSSFPVIIIRSLIAIYGELDIINPYRTNNEDRMGGFDANVTKFGYPIKKLEHFKNAFQNYLIKDQKQENVNDEFLIIEKALIDMFFFRKKNVNTSEEEIMQFQNLLYIRNNTNPIMQKLIESRINESNNIEKYYQSKLFETTHQFQLTPYKQNTLIPEAYAILGYTLENISQMDEKTLDQLNKQIYTFFKIDSNEDQKQERLKEAVAYYKQYGNSFTSGNGYVDMLLLLSIIATIMMTLFAITVKVLGG